MNNGIRGRRWRSGNAKARLEIRNMAKQRLRSDDDAVRENENSSREENI